MIFWIIVIIIIFGIVSILYIANENKKKVQRFIDQDERLKGAQLFEAAMNSYIIINENGYIGLKTSLSKEPVILHIKDLNGFEMKVDGNSTANLGGAIMGGLVFGGVGAIIGAFSSKKEKISELNFIFKTSNFQNPIIEIKMMDSKVNKSSLVYKITQEKIMKVTSLLEILEIRFKE